MQIGIIAVVLIFVILATLLAYFIPIPLWMAAYSSRAGVSLLALFMMRIRRIPPATIVNALIAATESGLKLSCEQLEAHFLAGGNVPLLTNALISAHKAGVVLSFERAAAIDLAGRDVFEAVKTTITPKVITTPEFKALPKDGIQVIVKAKITVKTNIDKVIGGATDDTIIARVNEGIVTEIGAMPSHQHALENPHEIGEKVEARKLDTGTAYHIISIDIVDINVGKNVGVEVQIEQANADRHIAQAAAEKRRSLAIAHEHEMKAKAEEARAGVIQAEAELPIALADALRQGKMGIMEYYQYRNIKADTEMRESIAHSATPKLVAQIEEVEVPDRDDSNR